MIVMFFVSSCLVALNTLRTEPKWNKCATFNSLVYPLHVSRQKKGDNRREEEHEFKWIECSVLTIACDAVVVSIFTHFHRAVSIGDASLQSQCTCANKQATWHKIIRKANYGNTLLLRRIVMRNARKYSKHFFNCIMYSIDSLNNLQLNMSETDKRREHEKGDSNSIHPFYMTIVWWKWEI